MTECERTALYLDGELPVADEPAVLAHLATCAACQEELGDWVGLETVLSRSRTADAQAKERFAIGSHDGHVERAIDGVAAKARETRTDGPDDRVVGDVVDRDLDPRGDRGVGRRGDRAGDSEFERRRDRGRRAGRGQRWRVVAAGVAIAAVAAIAVVWLGRDRAPRAPVIALAETRAIEARFTAPAFDHHRVYRVERGAAARELLPVDVLVALERAGDRAGLAAAHALAGDMARASAVLEAEPPSAARDSDRAAVALAEDPVRALHLADAAIAVAPALAEAHWNRALA
ncbi:MAG TPA: zf-HC2 domain-containing protein, partial [Kofleriaceae bacterium]|nr:zf-HC2 domain-containing protein [Kofleriaceae bacterium]